MHIVPGIFYTFGAIICCVALVALAAAPDAWAEYAREPEDFWAMVFYAIVLPPIALLFFRAGRWVAAKNAELDRAQL